MSSVESWEVWIALVEQDGTVPSHLYAQPVSHGRHIADLVGDFCMLMCILTVVQSAKGNQMSVSQYTCTL